jgi:hypothetical protein
MALNTMPGSASSSVSFPQEDKNDQLSSSRGKQNEAIAGGI